MEKRRPFHHNVIHLPKIFAQIRLAKHFYYFWQRHREQQFASYILSSFIFTHYFSLKRLLTQIMLKKIVIFWKEKNKSSFNANIKYWIETCFFFLKKEKQCTSFKNILRKLPSDGIKYIFFRHFKRRYMILKKTVS